MRFFAHQLRWQQLLSLQLIIIGLADQNHRLHYLINHGQSDEQATFTFPVPAGTEV